MPTTQNINQSKTFLFTSESVSAGHPDKVCDFVSDSILDAHLTQDPNSKVAIDCCVKGDTIYVVGELTSTAVVNISAVVRQAICSIGYDKSEACFDGNTCNIVLNISEQSPEINKAVFKDNYDIGAGDQGIMFGYACNQTKELMPLPIILAHKLAYLITNQTDNKVNNKTAHKFGPDAKTQITVEYNSDQTIKRIDTILVSTQHPANYTQDQIQHIIQDIIYGEFVPQNNLEQYIDTTTKLIINPSGSFIVGGPVADSGLTGRKIIVDGYGGWGRVGGGAFSGKDSSKVDRSGAYMARFLAKNIVAKGWANNCEIQISYAIGVAKPTSISLFGDLIMEEQEILSWINTNFDLRPKAIIDFLNLRQPIFAITSQYGHFGRDYDGTNFTWERILD